MNENLWVTVYMDTKQNLDAIREAAILEHSKNNIIFDGWRERIICFVKSKNNDVPHLDSNDNNAMKKWLTSSYAFEEFYEGCIYGEKILIETTPPTNFMPKQVGLEMRFE